MAEVTGLRWFDIMALVLAAVKPTLAAATIRVGRPLMRYSESEAPVPHPTVRLHAPFRWKDLRDLHAELRQSWEQRPDPEERLQELLARERLGDAAGSS